MAVVTGLELLARRIRKPPAAAFILKESGAVWLTQLGQEAGMV
jgi:hypothetical protein